MNKFEVLKPFHIKTDTYVKFQTLELALYNMLKNNTYTIDTEELYEYFIEFSDIEKDMREFHDRFRGRDLEEFIKEINGGLNCLVLDCTHRVELLSYTCAVQLLIQAILNNVDNRHIFVGILISVMNQYYFRGDKVPAYFQWNLQNSYYH